MLVQGSTRFLRSPSGLLIRANHCKPVCERNRPFSPRCLPGPTVRFWKTWERCRFTGHVGLAIDGHTPPSGIAFEIFGVAVGDGMTDRKLVWACPSDRNKPRIMLNHEHCRPATQTKTSSDGPGGANSNVAGEWGCGTTIEFRHLCHSSLIGRRDWRQQVLTTQ